MHGLSAVLGAAVAIVIGLGVFAVLVLTYFVGNYVEALHAWIHDGSESEETSLCLDGDQRPQFVLSRAQ